MNFEKKLKKIGITPLNKLSMQDKNNIIQKVAYQLSSNILELSDRYNEIYMRLFNCEMYNADIKPHVGKVFYYYKNNTLYFSGAVEIIDENVIHECIHYLQNFEKINKNVKRIGLCYFDDLKIQNLGLNEAVIAYISATALNNKMHRINNSQISIYSNSECSYKYLINLIYQIIFLLDDKEAIESCFNSTNTFEEELYNSFEENTKKILKKFDMILNEKKEENVIMFYMETQELIYKTFFNKICSRLTTIEEVDSQIEKLKKYNEIIGKYLDKENEQQDFDKFKIEMDKKFYKKYREISIKQSEKSALSIYKKTIIDSWKKIIEFFNKPKEKIN